jgi:hypothetical protein
MALLHGMGNTHSKLLLRLMREQLSEQDVNEIVDRIAATHGAYMEAIERVLGAATRSLHRTDTTEVMVWVNAVRGNPSGFNQRK